MTVETRPPGLPPQTPVGLYRWLRDEGRSHEEAVQYVCRAYRRLPHHLPILEPVREEIDQRKETAS